MLTFKLSIILRKNINYIVNLFSNRNINSTNLLVHEHCNLSSLLPQCRYRYFCHWFTTLDNIANLWCTLESGIWI